MVQQKTIALLKGAEAKLERVELPCESRRQLTRMEKHTQRIQRLPWWLSGKESTYQCRRHGLDP